MPQKNRNTLGRVIPALLAFLGPIIVGAVVIKVGGYVAFWLLCYFLMLAIPVLFIIWLIYRYIVHIAAEKVEDRFHEDGENFLSALEEQYDSVAGVVWDRSFRRRSRLSARKPFDKLAVQASPKWDSLSSQQKQKLAEELAGRLYAWIQEKGLERRGFDIKIDFYYGEEHPELVAKYDNGKLDLID